MRLAFVGGSVLALIAPVIGHYMVARRYANISDSLAHISLLGILAGHLLTASPLLLGLAVSIIAGVLMEYLRQKNLSSGDGILVLVTTFSIALVSIIQQLSGTRQSLESLLFGSILTITATDIIIVTIASAITALVLYIHRRALLCTILDSSTAKLQGFHPARLNYLLIILSAVVVAVSIKLLGGLLIGGIMIIPVLTSHLLSSSFYRSIGVSMVISVGSMWVGLSASWLLDIPSGAGIVAAASGVYILAALYTLTASGEY